MYSTYNESTSAITERFVKTLKAKIYKKMTANDSNFMINAIILIIILLVKNLLILNVIICLKKLKRILKLLILKLMVESELLSIRISLKIGQEKYLS